MSTAPAPPPPKPKAPPPPSNNIAKTSIGAAAASVSKRTFTVKSGVIRQAQRVVEYGSGGVGKSELASLLTQVGIRPLFVDVGSGTGFLNVDRIADIETWQDLRGVLHDETLWSSYGAVIIDDLTKAEELAASWVVENVKHEKGNAVSCIEDFGWGKGYTHVYDAFLPLLGDLDAHARAGRQVVCIAHECTASVPNPAGEDWIRFEPRLQSPTSGKSSIRHRVKEWCDHLLFIGFDVFATKDGKGQGAGTRTIYPSELPTHWAKSRCLASPIPYERGSGELWRQLFGEKQS